MKYTDLDLIANFVDNESFELEFAHPVLKSVLFQGNFETLEVNFSEDFGTFDSPPSCEIEINFEIDMSNLEILDNDGDEIDSVDREIIELVECCIKDYITDNSEEF
tara:strand:+ start:1953 stop:2270 length:318 start_codon:yes stop_codon:yes gene_type:complete